MPRKVLRNPHKDAAQEQHQHAPEESPEKKFLPRIVTSGRRHLLVLIRAVVLHRCPPFAIVVSVLHLWCPHDIHVPNRAEKDESCPRVPCSDNLPAAEEGSYPEKEPRRP